ncbi:hypothetical protein [Staphylococcus equorum]|uniref:hypothetical protein n=1 Tax=Staphylococcus equorum TaxID=246432 RepID=UPI00192CF205|nr:hypothetical protein [Staphylococcus equorum]
MSKRDRITLGILISIGMFAALVALSVWNRNFFVDIVAPWLTAIGTVGAVIVALWQTKRAENARINEKIRYEKMRHAEKVQHNEDLLKIIDSLTAPMRDKLEITTKSIDDICNIYKLSSKDYKKCDDIEYTYRIMDLETVIRGYRDDIKSLITSSSVSLNDVSLDLITPKLILLGKAELSLNQMFEAYSYDGFMSYDSYNIAIDSAKDTYNSIEKLIHPISPIKI